MADELQTAETPTKQPSAAPKRDFRQEVTNQIIEMLENGTAPWQKPWEPGALQLPFNPTTDRTYRGGNALHLMAVAARKGFEDPRWLTYRQAQENGWQVRKAEKDLRSSFGNLIMPNDPLPRRMVPTWKRVNPLAKTLARFAESTPYSMSAKSMAFLNTRRASARSGRSLRRASLC